MEKKTVNAESVATIKNTDTYELWVNEMLYIVTSIGAIAGPNYAVFTSVHFTWLGSVGEITFAKEFAITGGRPRETLITDNPIPRDTLAGLIAGSIAFDDARDVEYDRTH